MHIENNVTEMIWQTLDGRSDKDKIGKICNDVAEDNHALQSVIISNARNGNRNISLPWLLTEQQSSAIKEVIHKIRFSTRFSSNIQNILTKKVILVVLKLMTDIHSLR